MKSAYLSELSGQVDAATRRTEEIAAPLTEAQLAWRPGEGRWSVGECLDHLLVTNALYLGKMEEAIRRGHERGILKEDSVSTRHTLFGGFVYRTLLKPRAASRVSAPRMFVPAGDLAPGVVDRFVRSQVRLKEAMIDADGLDLDRIKFGTPVSAFLRANLGEALKILVLHEFRHLDQAQDVVDSDGFPE